MSATQLSTVEPVLVCTMETAELGIVGGKAAALAQLRAVGFRVPDWIVVTTEGFLHSLSPGERAALEHGGDRVRSVLEQIQPSKAVMEAVDNALTQFSSQYFAVRSSGAGEDGATHSHAGQFESYLCVERHQLAARIADVWRSAFNERLGQYRSELGVDAAMEPPAVIIQDMIDADCAGVAFSADPVSGRRTQSLVCAVPGLGTALVQGDGDADTYRVNAQGSIVHREIAHKRVRHLPDPKAPMGFREDRLAQEPPHHPTPDPSLSSTLNPALSDPQVLAVAALARATAAHFHCPQDIEWAVRNGVVYLLQSRPITSLSRLPDPDGCDQVWDNANIVESYSGITTPLTFSFAVHVYAGVYRQFCKLVRVAPARIAEHELTFKRMLGLIHGRMYYNLLSWYRVLALLPGFKVNRTFMEQMMGVQETLPPEVLPRPPKASVWERMIDGFRAVRTLTGLLGSHVTLGRRIRRFYARLNEALAPLDPPLSERRLDQLVTDYRELERRLLTRWDAPLINDFYAMVYFGVLGRLTRAWCQDSNGTLHNDLVLGQGDIISAEPARRIQQMAELVATREVDSLRFGPCDAALETIAANPSLNQAFEAYIDKFADRCLDELKLESSTLEDNPLTLIRAVGHAAARHRGPRRVEKQPEDFRTQAGARARAALSGRPLRRILFHWVTVQARRRVRDRENLRFERTRLFGRVRRIFVEMGRRLYAEGQLHAPRDIFFLECEEILGFVEGTASTADLKGLVKVRRAEFERYRQNPGPANRFRTKGAVPIANDLQACLAGHGDAGVDGSAEQGRLEEDLKGLGCCPGIVAGPVRVITDPTASVLKDGEILVAERTDPGWIMLFPAASGILVERGSLLSHSAIVAREMQIPAIVSIPNLSHRLQDGQWVEMDGATGTVRVLDSPQVPPEASPQTSPQTSPEAPPQASPQASSKPSREFTPKDAPRAPNNLPPQDHN